MKASRLHTYWRQICDNERQAKQRNETLMRDFERIDSHMSKLNARTQSLALMKVIQAVLIVWHMFHFVTHCYMCFILLHIATLCYIL